MQLKTFHPSGMQDWRVIQQIYTESNGFALACTDRPLLLFVATDDTQEVGSWSPERLRDGRPMRIGRPHRGKTGGSKRRWEPESWFLAPPHERKPMQVGSRIGGTAQESNSGRDRRQIASTFEDRKSDANRIPVGRQAGDAISDDCRRLNGRPSKRMLHPARVGGRSPNAEPDEQSSDVNRGQVGRLGRRGGTADASRRLNSKAKPEDEAPEEGLEVNSSESQGMQQLAQAGS